MTSKAVGPHSAAERLRSVDKRTRLGRYMCTFRSALLDALGGVEGTTPQRAMLIELAVTRAARLHLLAPSILAGDASEESERRWCWHANGLRRDLALLGLERMEPPPTTLATIIENYNETQPADPRGKKYSS